MATTFSDKSYSLNIADPERWYVQKTLNIHLLIHVFIKILFLHWMSGGFQVIQFNNYEDIWGLRDSCSFEVL